MENNIFLSRVDRDKSERQVSSQVTGGGVTLRLLCLTIVCIAGRREDRLGVSPHHPPAGPQLWLWDRRVRRPRQSSLHQR